MDALCSNIKGAILERHLDINPIEVEALRDAGSACSIGSKAKFKSGVDRSCRVLVVCRADRIEARVVEPVWHPLSSCEELGGLNDLLNGWDDSGVITHVVEHVVA